MKIFQYHIKTHVGQAQGYLQADSEEAARRKLEADHAGEFVSRIKREADQDGNITEVQETSPNEVLSLELHELTE